MTLEEIAKKHKTTKWPHGYMPIYENYFNSMRDAQISLLEIGIAEGNSLRMWQEYFTKAIITGVDKVAQCEGVIEGDITEQVTQNKLGEFDIIIDDASHRAGEQLATFYNLWPKLKPGGYYIIEDLFTLYDKVWNPEGLNIIDEIYNRMQSIIIEGDTIQEVHFYGRNDINGIVFLRKRFELFRFQPLDEFQNI